MDEGAAGGPADRPDAVAVAPLRWDACAQTDISLRAATLTPSVPRAVRFLGHHTQRQSGAQRTERAGHHRQRTSAGGLDRERATEADHRGTTGALGSKHECGLRTNNARAEPSIGPHPESNPSVTETTHRAEQTENDQVRSADELDPNTTLPERPNIGPRPRCARAIPTSCALGRDGQPGADTEA